MKKIFLIGGARPNFIKISPISRSFDKHGLSYEIIHTGQHYDYELDKVFFNEFNLKPPFQNLNVGSKSHGAQTGEIMIKFEQICMKYKPDLVFVVGDVNSTVACSLVSTKLEIPLAHQEAGCRSENKTPEEINRRVTDVMSDYLFTSAPEDRDNLLREGISKEKIFLVGDVIIDNLIYFLNKIETKVKKGIYCLVTIHRNFNVDNKGNLTEILKALSEIGKMIKVYFPMHPRTKKMVDVFGLNKYLHNLEVTSPMGYIEFITNLKNCSVLITDSGSLQVESTYLNIPCINIKKYTTSKFTVEQGTNILVGDPNSTTIVEKVVEVLKNPIKSNLTQEMKILLDGNASDRISEAMKEILK